MEFLNEGEDLIALVSGKMTGDQDEDKPYCGHELEVTAKITFYRVSGAFGFESYEIEVAGGVVEGPDDNDDGLRESLSTESDIEEIGSEPNRVDPLNRIGLGNLEALLKAQDQMKPFIEAVQRLQDQTNLFIRSPGFRSFVSKYEVMMKQVGELGIHFERSLRPYLESREFQTAMLNIAGPSEKK